MSEIERDVAWKRDVDRRLRQLEGGQRVATSSSAVAVDDDWVPDNYGTLETALTLPIVGVRALAVASVTVNKIGSYAPEYGVADIGVRLAVGARILAEWFPWGEFVDGLETFRYESLVGHADLADGDDVELQVIEYEGGGGSAANPWAFVALSLFVVPVTAFA